jgi:cation:H+ antiporter
MLLALAALLTGLLLLAWAADRLVDGAVALAHHARIPPLLVGLVVVGFGASSAELAVATAAAWHGHPALALGSAWGANIVDLSLVLGVTALVAPIRAPSPALHRELPLLLAATVFTGALIWDGVLSRVDAALLLAGFAALLVWSWRQARRREPDALGDETAHGRPAAALGTGRALRRTLLALLVLAGGSALLVWGAVPLARGLGVSDLTLGLGVVALGTTLPGLASCVNAARQGEHDIALGHVLGASLFNTLAVAGLAGLIEPLDVEITVLWRDLPVMAGLALGLYLIGRDHRRPTELGRGAGRALVAVYLLHAMTVVITSGPG